MESDAGRRIVITGTFCALNKGDAAMRIGLTDALLRAMPDSQITLMSPYPEIDSPTYAGGRIVRCSRRRPLKFALTLAKAALWRAYYRVFRKDPPWGLNEELRAYRDSDVVVDLSGDGLTEEYGPKCIYSHLAPIVLAKLLGKPVFVCAQTIGPLRKTLRLSRWLLRRVDRVSAREQRTLDYLAKLGINGSTVSLSADVAFLMAPAPADRARRILADEAVPFDKPLVGLSVSRLPGHALDSFGPNSQVDLEVELAETLDRMVEMGLRPVMISHVTGPGERRDDRLAALRIAAMAKSRSQIVTLLGDYAPEEIKAVISQMEMFVGVRMHSCIAALSTFVPTISIAYGPKAFGIMSQVGQADRALDIRELTADKLTRLVEETWRKRDLIRESLRARMPKVRVLAERNVEIIQELVKGNA
ncbi:MAG: polysaccharide pyruvyl transferase family protein [Armatimonadota bacterium]|nr:polysaccharide pyruvyl transferase family protein [Armatimonadota bacterium]